MSYQHTESEMVKRWSTSWKLEGKNNGERHDAVPQRQKPFGSMGKEKKGMNKLQWIGGIKVLLKNPG